MNSFMSWVGGKKSLRDKILIRFPLDYGRYIEVFGGAGWVLFHKTPEAFEVFNDANSNLVNLYRCVRQNARKLIYKLRYMINARDDFRCIVQQRRRGLFTRFHDYDRAAKFYYLIQYSYGHKTDQYCCKPVSMWKRFPLIERAAERLQNVVIENNIGLIMGYIRYDTYNKVFTSDVVDMYYTEQGSIDTMPDVQGVGVTNGYDFGVYVGGGQVVFSSAIGGCVQQQALEYGNWTSWCTFDAISYPQEVWDRVNELHSEEENEGA